MEKNDYQRDLFERRNPYYQPRQIEGRTTNQLAQQTPPYGSQSIFANLPSVPHSAYSQQITPPVTDQSNLLSQSAAQNHFVDSHNVPGVDSQYHTFHSQEGGRATRVEKKERKAQPDCGICIIL